MGKGQRNNITFISQSGGVILIDPLAIIWVEHSPPGGAKCSRPHSAFFSDSKKKLGWETSHETP